MQKTEVLCLSTDKASADLEAMHLRCTARAFGRCGLKHERLLLYSSASSGIVLFWKDQ